MTPISLTLGSLRPGGAAGDLSLFARVWAPRTARGTIACFHGYTDNSSDFTAFGEAAARAGYRVVCPDWPGRGRSPWLAAHRYDLGLFRSVMGWVLREARPPVTLLASSWSTFVAIPHLAASRPPVANAVLVDAILQGGAALDHVVGVLSGEASTSFRDLSALADHLAETRPSLAGLPRPAQERYARRRAAYVDGRLRLDYDPQLGPQVAGIRGRPISLEAFMPKIAVPTLMAYGEGSIFRDAALFARVGAANRLIALDEGFPGGHPPLLEGEGEIGRILRFIEGAGPAGR